MRHTVDLAIQTDEQTKLGDVTHFAFDFGADRVMCEEVRPWIFHALLEAQRNTTLVGIGVEHHDFDLLRGGNDFARMHVFLGPAHLGDVYQTFDTGFEFNESAIIGDVGNATFELGTVRVFAFDAFPRIGLELLHTQRDTLRFSIEADHLDFHRLADLQGLGRVVDALPCNVGDVQQAVDAAQVHERTVIGDVLDHTLEDLTLFEVLHQFRTGFRAGLFKHRTARHNDVVARLVHLEDLERLRGAHQRRDIAHRTDVDLAARQEGHGARKIDDEAAFDATKDHAVDALLLVESFLQLGPCLFAAGFFTAQPDHTVAIFITLDEHIDFVARLDREVLTWDAKFFNRHATFGFEAYVDNDGIAVNRDHRAF